MLGLENQRESEWLQSLRRARRMAGSKRRHIGDPGDAMLRRNPPAERLLALGWRQAARWAIGV